MASPTHSHQTTSALLCHSGPATMESTSFMDLPLEMQTMVTQYLTPRELAACAEVSRAWKSFFHPRLWRHLDIVWTDSTRKRTFSMAVKLNCHLIHSLKLEVNDQDSRTFLEQCSFKFSRLDSLELYGPKTSEWELYLFIRLSAIGWKGLVFRIREGGNSILRFGSCFFNDLLIYAASTLQVLRLEGHSYAYGASVNQLLCSAPNLRELFISTDRMDSKGGWLDAEDVVKSEWVCTNLEVFVCRIRNIPRPDIARNVLESGPSGRPRFFTKGSFEESLDLQRRVYAKLARLTKLRELVLGYVVDQAKVSDNSDVRKKFRNYYRQYDCPAMTLDSGLDLLRGLKNLQIVGLEDMEVYVDGDSEQRWFAENWPHAKISTTQHTLI